MMHLPSNGRRRAIALSGAIALAVFPAIASATLGEPVDSIQADQAQLKGSLKSVSHANFRVHEMQLPSGTVLRQYAAADGMVFAVTWSGPSMPDLRQTLGRYFDSYLSGAAANRGGHRRLKFHNADLIVEAGGHMRSFTGRAYLANFLPAGVSPENLP